VVVPAQFFVCGPIASGLVALAPGFIALVISNVLARSLTTVFGPGLVAFGIAFGVILGLIALKVFYEPGLTSYAIYPDRIEFEEGLLNHQHRTVLLDKIVEVRLIESILQRTAGAGSISLVSQQPVGAGAGRVSKRTVRMINVPDPGGVYELIRSLALGCRGAKSTLPE
jgi:uncharacterized membrane protein YdbT with pleckstrin-like domain